jgi:hypothetical protein
MLSRWPRRLRRQANSARGFNSPQLPHLRFSSSTAIWPNTCSHARRTNRRVNSAEHRGVAQSGSALGWGPSGRWFKSSRPDFRKPAWGAGFRRSGPYGDRLTSSSWYQPWYQRHRRRPIWRPIGCWLKPSRPTLTAPPLVSRSSRPGDDGDAGDAGDAPGQIGHWSSRKEARQGADHEDEGIVPAPTRLGVQRRPSAKSESRKSGSSPNSSSSRLRKEAYRRFASLRRPCSR